MLIISEYSENSSSNWKGSSDHSIELLTIANDSLLDNNDSYGDTVVIFVFGIVLTFITCVIGTIGNSISIIVLIKLAFGVRGARCPLFIILIALASSDSAVLLLNFWTNILSIGLPYTKFQFTIPLYLNHGYIIRIFWPLLLGAQMSSIYFTVLVSYERWLAVVKPFRASRRRFSLQKLSLLIGGILLLSIIYNIPRWFEYIPLKDSVKDIITLLPVKYFCKNVLYNATEIKQKTEHYASLLTSKCNISVFSFTKSNMGNSLWYRYGYCAFLYVLVMFLVPVILITYMNVALVKCVKKSKEKWGSMSRLQRKEVKLSYVPLAIVCMFYIFGIPAVVINFIDSLDVAPSNKTSPGFELWQAALNVSNFFVILNSAINFLIYCFLGEKFRSTLIGIFCSCRGHSVFSTGRNNSFLRSTLQHQSKSLNTSLGCDEISNHIRQKSNDNNNNNNNSKAQEHQQQNESLISLPS